MVTSLSKVYQRAGNPTMDMSAKVMSKKMQYGQRCRLMADGILETNNG